MSTLTPVMALKYKLTIDFRSADYSLIQRAFFNLRGQRMKKTISTLLVIVVFLVLRVEVHGQRRPRPKIVPPPKAKAEPLTAKRIFELYAPSVVVVTTYDDKGKITSVASGIIISPLGYIATNAHVVTDAASITASVHLAEYDINAEYKDLKLMGLAQDKDIAVLKLEAKNLPFFQIPFDDVPLPKVGQKVYAIGNPRGLENTLTDGIISGLRELVNQRLVQHSAPISPGSSGGPLIDEFGNLVGMNTFLLDKSQNLNFAVHINDIRKVFFDAILAKQSLPFPRSKLETVEVEDPLDALIARDYIKAITAANKIVADGKPTSKEYSIIGMAYFELGKFSDAETYLKQSILLSGDDDEYKQTARYYLMRIAQKQYIDDLSTQNQANLGARCRAILKSSQKTIFTDEGDKKAREAAQRILDLLADLSGEWVEQRGQLYFFHTNNRYRVMSSGNGRYTMEKLPEKDNSRGRENVLLLYTFFGSLAVHDGVAVGKGKCGIAGFAAGEGSSVATVAAQEVSMKFTLSEDFSTLTGTATYYSVEGKGSFYDLWRKLSQPRTETIVLVRR